MFGIPLTVILGMGYGFGFTTLFKAAGVHVQHVHVEFVLAARHRHAGGETWMLDGDCQTTVDVASPAVCRGTGNQSIQLMTRNLKINRV